MNKLRLRVIRWAFQFLSPLFPRTFGLWAMQLFLRPIRYPTPDWEEKNLLHADERFVRANYCLTTYGKDGPWVMFVHGWSGRGSQFSCYAEPLVTKGYRVALFDGPAHFPESPDDLTDIAAFSDAIIDAQKELGDVHAIVAHSFGGGATALALKKGLRVNKAVFVATPANLQRVFDAFSRRLRLHAKAKAIFQEAVSKRVGVTATEASVIHLGPSMSVPALVVHDPEDKEVSFVSAQEFEKYWPGAKVFAPKRVGHYRVLKDTTVIRRVIEFVEEK